MIYISHWLLFRWQQSLNLQIIRISKRWEIICSWNMGCHNRQDTRPWWKLQFWPYSGPNYWQTRTRHASTEEVWLSIEENRVKAYILPTSLWQIYKQFLFSAKNWNKDFGDQKKGQHKNPSHSEWMSPCQTQIELLLKWYLSPVYLLIISLYGFCSILSCDRGY